MTSGPPDGATPAPGFSGRLTAAFPSQVVADITEVCNLACVHCPHPAFRRSDQYGARSLPPELNERMVEEVREHGRGATRYIRYASNGEPLLHPDSYRMIEYAVRRSGVFVTLTTNGTIMDEEKTRRLLDSGIHMIDVSIDALTPGTYAAIRVNGDLAVTRGNVLRLIEWARLAGGRTRVVVSFVEQPANAHETKGFRDYWEGRGADFVVVRRMHSFSGAQAGLADARRRELGTAARYPCLYPWERIVLNAKGELAYCPSDWLHDSRIADYRETTILEAWRGEFYRRLREAHLANDFSGFPFCGQCPDWASTRWPGQGRSYADLIADFSKEGGEDK